MIHSQIQMVYVLFFFQILPLLMSPTLEDQERHLLVKVIDRVLYKLDDLVRPYVHKILVVIEPLLIDEVRQRKCVRLSNSKSTVSPNTNWSMNQYFTVLWWSKKSCFATLAIRLFFVYVYFLFAGLLRPCWRSWDHLQSCQGGGFGHNDLDDASRYRQHRRVREEHHGTRVRRRSIIAGNSITTSLSQGIPTVQ